MPEKKRLLVVDDNANFLELAALVLGEHYDLAVAEDGAKGLAEARAKHPDLILLDVMMPRVSGMELLRELQSDMDLRKVPVLVLTASALDDSTQRLIEHEINVKGFLRKPVGIEKLRRQIQLALGGA